MAPGSTGMLTPLSDPGSAYECEAELEQVFQGGILDGRIHDAQGIHNICIYDKQDVFAKFSFTHGKVEPFCTQVITKGGKNPVFNECFQLPVTLPESVLKCEIWMSSRAHSYLEDQLLGFALVPLSSLADKPPGVAEEYGLSSTELFHSPAGVVRLTLLFLEEEGIRMPEAAHSQTDSPNGSPDQMKSLKDKHGFIKVFEDGSTGSESPPPCYESEELERVEFPDLHAASEDEQLVSSYLKLSASASRDPATACTPPAFAFEMKAEYTKLTRSTESAEKATEEGNLCTGVARVETNSDESQDGSQTCGNSKEGDVSSETGVSAHGRQQELVTMRSLEDSSPQVVKQQIVDIYMKSMQQFTEALSRMQLPLQELEKTQHEATPNPKKNKSHNSKKTSGVKSHRVFYGTRAFF